MIAIHSRIFKDYYLWNRCSFVRDPLLLSGLVSMWLTPFMTTRLFVIWLLTSAYLYLGSLHWESRLLAQFGKDYEDYRKNMLRMIPWKRNRCSSRLGDFIRISISMYIRVHQLMQAINKWSFPGLAFSIFSGTTSKKCTFQPSSPHITPDESFRSRSSRSLALKAHP
jgi:hypothetical protein